MQKGNRIQIPKLIRWQHKLEPHQVLRAHVSLLRHFPGEEFYTHMTKDGRLVIPQLTLRLLGIDDENLVGQILEIQLSPVENP